MRAEWRDCVWARRCYSSPDDSVRECRVRGHMITLVKRDDCATCPVPLFVGAVKAAHYIVESRTRPEAHGRAASEARRRSDEHIGTFMRAHEDTFKAAHDALPKEGS